MKAEVYLNGNLAFSLQPLVNSPTWRGLIGVSLSIKPGRDRKRVVSLLRSSRPEAPASPGLRLLLRRGDEVVVRLLADPSGLED
jgi:hypothetical protein